MLFNKPLLVAVNSRYTHSNPAVYCLKSYLKAQDLAVDLIEFNINGQALDMLAAIVDKKPDLVGFSCYIWNIKIIGALTKMLKKVLPQCRILWGGPQMNGSAAHWLRQFPEVDYIIEGEGEIAWQQLLAKNDGSADFADVPNLIWRKHQGQNSEIIKNSRGDYVDLSEIPFYYSDDDLADLKNRIIYYESSRGCPFGCKFCLSSREPVRYRDLSLVKEDLYRLANSGCKKIKFVDRTFNSNKKRAVAILEYLLSIYRKDICFHLELEPLCLDEELVNVLLKAPAGYFQAEIGVQSLYDKSLKAIGRRNLAPNAVELIGKLIAAENIHIHLDLIGGLPYEDLAEFKNSFDALYEIFPHYLQLGFLKILPGTPLAEEAAGYGLDYVDEPPYQVLQTPWLPYEDMQELACTEHAVDNYYNEMFFEETLKFAVGKWCESGRRPFDFFNGLGKADLAVDGGKNQQQKAKILMAFILENLPVEKSVICDTLAVDFVNGGIQPPDFVQSLDEMAVLKDGYDNIIQKLPALAELPRRKWLKRYRVFQINNDVSALDAGTYVADYEAKIGIWQRPQLIKIK